MILIPATHDDWRHRLSESTTVHTSTAPAQMADRWQAAAGFPAEIARLFSTARATRSAALLVAIPNHQVRLAGGAHAAHLDLWALVRTGRGLLSVAIDAVGAEPFDAKADDRTATTESRRLWKGLCRLLEIHESADTPVSSQLVHRTTTALVEAKRFFARGAAVVIHSFSESRGGFSDFQQFVKLMGGALVEPGQLVEVQPREGVELYFGWAQAPQITAQPSGA